MYSGGRPPPNPNSSGKLLPDHDEKTETSSKASSFTQFLEECNLGSYKNALMEAFAEKYALEKLLTLSRKDIDDLLKSCVLKPGHRARFHRELPYAVKRMDEEKTMLLAKITKNMKNSKFCARFDEAMQQHIRLPPIKENICSFSAWFRMDPAIEKYNGFRNGGGGYLLSSNYYNRDKNYGFSIFKVDDKVSGIYVAERGGPHFRLQTNVCDGKWHHIAQTKSDVYVDGTRVGALSNKLTQAKGSFRIGYGKKGEVGFRSSKGANIEIFNFILFAETLYPEEIKKCAADKNAMYTCNPVAFLPLCSDCRDISGNGYHGSPCDKNGQKIPFEKLQAQRGSKKGDQESLKKKK